MDATVGAGGHAEAILTASSRVTVLGLDRDPEAVEVACRRLARFGERAQVRQANFRELATTLRAEGVTEVAAILFDLGTSGMQLKNPRRGFSFMAEGPLDMRMGPDAHGTAETLLNRLSEEELARIIGEYGEERYARRIARRIVAGRGLGGLSTTKDLARIIADCVPPPSRGREQLHPATRTFQAIRIAVNDELIALEEALPQALAALRVTGRLAVISFHSLEDRRVKQFFAREARDCLCPPTIPVCRCGHKKQLTPLTRKPLVPGAPEIMANPQARSAKLRVAERV